MTQTNRMAADAAHGFGGTLLRRDRPLRFRLDGEWIEGCEGDTVLSAALANGIASAGRHEGHPVALTAEFAPLVRQRGDDDSAALPATRTPAVDGADLVSLAPDRSASDAPGWLGALRRRFNRERGPMRHRFGDTATTSPPWLSASPSEALAADLVVIGAGIAGLAAAGAAATLGKRVIVLERRPTPGGLLHYFGSIEGEDGPDALLAGLLKGLDGRGSVRIETATDAFGIGRGKVVAHRVRTVDGHASGEVLDIEAAAVVIATGSGERLPIFPGNRLPGVVGATSTFLLAMDHGVWLGKRTTVATPNSHAYRLAIYAADAGQSVQRIVDARLAPHSRFIDFCKASGITLASGLMVAEASQTKDAGLQVVFAASTEGAQQAATSLTTDTLVAAGSFQPELGLWVAVGGEVTWSVAEQAIAPIGSLDGVRIVGSAAGWRSNTAVIASGRAAALELMGKTAPSIEERLVPVQFETPDAPAPISTNRADGRGTAYFDRGASLFRGAGPGHPGPLSLGDVAAAAATGLLPGSEANAVVRERTGQSTDLPPSTWAPTAVPGDDIVPPYLTGRFGPKPLICKLAAPDAKPFSPGSLVFRGHEVSDPAAAIGVVIAAPPPGESGGTALIADPPDTPDVLIFVNETGGASPARVVERGSTART